MKNLTRMEGVSFLQGVGVASIFSPVHWDSVFYGITIQLVKEFIRFFVLQICKFPELYYCSAADESVSDLSVEILSVLLPGCT